MDFSHFPRLENDGVVLIHWPCPPDLPNFKSLPRLAPRNKIKEPLAPGKSIVVCHSAANFTRFIASIASDQPMQFTAKFSLDEVAPDGSYVSDKNIADLNWDVTTDSRKYTPGEVHKGVWLIRAGKWMRVEVTNLGDKPAEALRVYVRGTPL